jgi:amidophosphoribosyltransferase
MIGARDPLGIRPLVLGDLDGAWILASETCALDIMGARFVRDVEPGEVVVITDKGIESHFPFEKQSPPLLHLRICLFRAPGLDHREPQRLRGAQEDRRGTGQGMPGRCRRVVPVPDSGTPAAIGFAQQADLPFELGIIRNHYVGRTFIQPTDSIRHMGVKLKHNANRNIDRGQARGPGRRFHRARHHQPEDRQMVREAGAREVHMRIASPPTMSSCYYGVDTPETNPSCSPRA